MFGPAGGSFSAAGAEAGSRERAAAHAAVDPYAILHELEHDRAIRNVLIGALARVSQGSDEVTRGVDLTPATEVRNLERLENALGHLHARRVDRIERSLADAVANQESVIEYGTDHGEVKVVVQPEGTRGYDDLRRRGGRLHLGDPTGNGRPEADHPPRL
jgi:hypothetical protein